jgi:hypothetical protein
MNETLNDWKDQLVPLEMEGQYPATGLYKDEGYSWENFQFHQRIKKRYHK